jgi:16S rRNA (cytosine1402-N4)-methyltransferase
MHQPTPLHLPVLVTEVLTYLNPSPGESYLDLTAGYGGHASVILEQTQNPLGAVLIDRDERAIAELQVMFSDQPTIWHLDFQAASERLIQENRHFDLILADLGVSSPHLNEAQRGFSIQMNGPLDMRMDQSQALTAAKVVNSYSEEQLVHILSSYGEEPKSRQIARLIIANRPFSTTAELATVVRRAWPGHSRVHPATRTFQALRIAVNNELSQLEQSLSHWIDLLNPNGRLVVISFHSLEDRLVKQAFQDRAGDGFDATIRVLTKRPVTASATELVINPRARSAKLRAAAKINI